MYKMLEQTQKDTLVRPKFNVWTLNFGLHKHCKFALRLKYVNIHKEMFTYLKIICLGQQPVFVFAAKSDAIQ